MIQIRDYETLLWHEVRAIDFDPKHGGFGRILFTMADGQLWEFQLCTNALKRGIDGIVIDGFQPVKTVQGCKAAVFELLYRFDKDAPLESAIRTAGILNRNCAPFDSLSPKGKKYGRLTITDKGHELNYAGKDYCFEGTARWKILDLLMNPTSPGGWVKLPNGSKSLGTFDKNDAHRFKKAAIEAKSAGSGGDGSYRIRP